MERILDIFLHLPEHLESFVKDHGLWVYALLFAIIFVETGLVIMPFLPGDSLLFAVGALAAPGEMPDGAIRPPILSFWGAFFLLTVAAILGDAVNYHLGKLIGPRVFKSQPGQGATRLERMMNRRHLDRAHEFFEKYGGKAVILGRFVPIVRTFVPFVAGAGAMTYRKFLLYNITGAVAWIGLCMGAGWFFGNMPWVRKNFELVVVGIIIVSVIPIAVEMWMARRKASGIGHQASAEVKTGSNEGANG